jgi:hypothetical protein
MAMKTNVCGCFGVPEGHPLWVINNIRHPNWLGSWNGNTGLGGSDVLVILIHVSHFRFFGDRDVTARLL